MLFMLYHLSWLIFNFMNKDDIKLSDLYRIIIGNAPLEFLLEVVVRTILTYLILLVVIRLMGKRMSGQLTSTEMAVMLLLGAIVSAPMQMPDRGILQGVLLLFLILFFQQWFTDRMRKNERLEQVLQGELSILVADGELQFQEMNKVNISHEQLFAVLRSQQIYNLGEVKRLYLEVCGEFTTYKQKEPRPGLSILPRMDDGIHKRQTILENNEKVCGYCGHRNPPVKQHNPILCEKCGKEELYNPVL
jgi:uncharacterized membrane protein YcaP (DUF421 family)